MPKRQTATRRERLVDAYKGHWFLYSVGIAAMCATGIASPNANPASQGQYFSTGSRPSGWFPWWPVAADPIAKAEDWVHHSSRGQHLLAEAHKFTTGSTATAANSKRLPTASLSQLQSAVSKLRAGPANHCFTYPSEVQYYKTLRVVVDGHTADPTATLCLRTDVARVAEASGQQTAFMSVIVDPDYRQTVFASSSLPQTFANESITECNRNTATLRQYGEILLHIEGGLSVDRWSPVQVMLYDPTHPGMSNPICGIPSIPPVHNQPRVPLS